jgi:hypothetical protein
MSEENKARIREFIDTLVRSPRDWEGKFKIKRFLD